MRIPDEALRAACEVLSGGVEGAEEDPATADLAGRLIHAVMPSIRAAERSALAQVIPPAQLEELAHLVSLSPGTVLQLQTWARILRSRPDSLEPVEMVVEAHT